MTATVDYLPIWKRKATAAERFNELAAVAAKHPERFSKVAIIYEEKLPDDRTVVRQISSGCNTTEVLGLLHLGQVKVLEDAKE